MLERFRRVGLRDCEWIPLSGGIASIYLGTV